VARADAEVAEVAVDHVEAVGRDGRAVDAQADGRTVDAVDVQRRPVEAAVDGEVQVVGRAVPAERVRPVQHAEHLHRFVLQHVDVLPRPDPCAIQCQQFLFQCLLQYSPLLLLLLPILLPLLLLLLLLRLDNYSDTALILMH